MRAELLAEFGGSVKDILRDEIKSGVDAALKPLLGGMAEFHEGVKSTHVEDVRMYWDVRLVQGDGSPLMQISGISTLSGLLHGNAITDAAGKVYQEVEEKVAKPLSQRIQQRVASGMNEALSQIAMKGLPDAPDDNGLAEAVDREHLRDAAARRFEDQQT